jgi:hypothetical protein
VNRQIAILGHVITAVLAVVAFCLFGWLALRHVGESYFLADQIDQLQKFEALLRLEPEGLLGGVMSGTEARALGPFGAIVFGVPVALGFGINAIHALTSVFLVLAAALVFWELSRLDRTMAWAWLIVFTAMRMVWWNAAMFWVCTLLLPLGLVQLALFVAILRNPTSLKLTSMALALVLALHVHLVALVGLPLLVLAVVVSSRRGVRESESTPRGVAHVVVAVLLIAAVVPYAAAEGLTNFRNTRAMVAHVDTSVRSVRSAGSQGRSAALETLVLATDPAGIAPGAAARTIIGAGAIVAFAALALAFVRGIRATSLDEQRQNGSMVWLTIAAAIGVAGQALFFFLMARPLNGLHYAMLLAPWYAVPPAALVAGLVPRRGVPGVLLTAIIGIAAVDLLFFRAPALADRYAERTPWTYQAIVSGLDSLCAGQQVDTVEGPGLVDELNPSYDPVLRYLMKRGFTRCRYEKGARLLIAGERGGKFDGSLVVGGRRFTREEVVPPGLARYRGR